jgi:hypothetical protein
MKKNLIYLGILIVLAVVAYLALNRKSNPFPEGDTNFKVEDVEEVTDIFLSNPQGNRVHLNKRDKDNWVVNDSFQAKPTRIVSILDALATQEATQLLPEAQHDFVVKSMSSSAVKVEVYKGKKKTNAFYVAMQPTPENTTVMLNIKEDGQNAKRLYIVKQGIQNNFLGVRYLTDSEDWRDQQILYIPKDELAQIKITYPVTPENSFTMNLKPSLSVQGETVLEGKTFNKKRAESYAGFFDKLYCLGFENDYYLKDTFVKAFTPFAKIELKGKDTTLSLDIYYRQVYKGTHSIIEYNGVQYDGDTFFGWLNKRDFILVGKNSIQKLLRSYDEFYTAEKPLLDSK